MTVAVFPAPSEAAGAEIQTTAVATMAAPQHRLPSAPRPIRGSAFGAPASPRKPAITEPRPAPEASDLGTTRSGYSFVSFRTLSGFRYPEDPPGAGGMSSKPRVEGPNDPHIPPQVRQFHEKQVLAMGYMLPLKRTADNRVATFLLMRDQSLCCFGRFPRVNDFIAVRMKPDRSAPAVEDEPILASGKLHVGAIYEEDLLLGIYAMTGELVETRADLEQR
jgi:hypothetical protein